MVDPVSRLHRPAMTGRAAAGHRSRRVGVLVALARSRPGLVAENTLLRHQLTVLRRSVKRPRCISADRAVPVLLASRVRAWQQARFIVQPHTLLR